MLFLLNDMYFTGYLNKWQYIFKLTTLYICLIMPIEWSYIIRVYDFFKSIAYSYIEIVSHQKIVSLYINIYLWLLNYMKSHLMGWITSIFSQWLNYLLNIFKKYWLKYTLKIFKTCCFCNICPSLSDPIRRMYFTKSYNY